MGTTIKEIKNFSDKWIKGTKNAAKDAVEKHVKGEHSYKLQAASCKQLQSFQNEVN